MCTLQIIQMDEWLAGVILTGVIGIVTWVFIRSINSQDELAKSVTSLRITLEGIKTLMDGFVAERDIFKESCTDRHRGVDETLADHEKSIRKHEEKIIVIETIMKKEAK